MILLVVNITTLICICAALMLKNVLILSGIVDVLPVVIWRFLFIWYKSLDVVIKWNGDINYNSYFKVTRGPGLVVPGKAVYCHLYCLIYLCLILCSSYPLLITVLE